MSPTPASGSQRPATSSTAPRPGAPVKHDTIAIVDFGSQFTQLIARRVREAGVFCEIVPFQAADEAFHRIQPKAVILSGGPASTTETGSPRAPQIVFEAGVPVLGIC